MEWLINWEQWIAEWISVMQSWGIWFAFAGYGLNVLCNVIGLPTIVLSTANVAVFGWGYGLLLSWAGEMSGSWLAFWLFRKGLKRYPSVGSRSARWVSFIDHEHRGIRIGWIALMRFTFLPSNVITFICVVASVRSIDFLVGTAIGKLPSIVLESLVGQQLIAPLSAGWTIAATLAMLVLYYVLYRFSNRQVNR